MVNKWGEDGASVVLLCAFMGYVVSVFWPAAIRDTLGLQPVAPETSADFANH